MRIDKNHIDQWADAFESKENFPTLISKLVNSTASKGTFINIPCGSAVANPGWDGIVRADEQRSYIPSGTSLWEFGTDQSVKGKAEGDYIKRTNDPLGHDPSQCVHLAMLKCSLDDNYEHKKKLLLKTKNRLHPFAETMTPLTHIYREIEDELAKLQ